LTVQAVLTSDNHMDPTAISFGTARLQRKKDHTRAFEEVVGYARETKPDLFLISGDLFDQIRPGNWLRSVLMQNLKTLYNSGIKTFMISGDHDTPKSIEEGVSPLSIYDSSGYAVYFENPADPKPRSMTIDGKQVNVFGVGLNPFLSSTDDPLAKVSMKKTEGINILLTHYPIEGFSGYIGQQPSIRLSSIPSWFLLVSAGHFHNHQLKKLGRTTIVFPGSTERASFAEENEDKGFVWAEIKDDGEVTTEFIKTHPRPFKTVELDFPEEGNVNSFVEEHISRLSDQELVLRIRLKGRINVDRLTSYRRPDVLSFAQGKFFFCSIEEDFEVQAPEPVEALARTTPLAEIRRYFETLIASSEEPDKKKILREALSLSESKLQEAGAW
jgi:DNA repair protein SbcD/Mre11